jgi:hypothetical protein
VTQGVKATISLDLPELLTIEIGLKAVRASNIYNIRKNINKKEAIKDN